VALRPALLTLVSRRCYSSAGGASGSDGGLSGGGSDGGGPSGGGGGATPSPFTDRVNSRNAPCANIPRSLAMMPLTKKTTSASSTPQPSTVAKCAASTI
jgi:hypothetical protein